MNPFYEFEVSQAILNAYHEKFGKLLKSDVIIVGAGPSGLVAAWLLAEMGYQVLVLEKRLSPGGGIWGGSIGMNEAAVQPQAREILEQAGVRYREQENLLLVDTIELAAALVLKAVHAGATLLNLMTAEDICIRNDHVFGVVANRTLIGESLPIDPIVFTTRAVVDATGHEARVAHFLRNRGLLKDSSGEGPMNASVGDRFVVDHVTEIYPGLWITGMSVCACQGGPRMGPIFSGMLLSGAKVAREIARKLEQPA